MPPLSIIIIIIMLPPSPPYGQPQHHPTPLHPVYITLLLKLQTSWNANNSSAGGAIGSIGGVWPPRKKSGEGGRSAGITRKPRGKKWKRILWRYVWLTRKSVELRSKYTRRTQDGRKKYPLCVRGPISVHSFLGEEHLIELSELFWTLIVRFTWVIYWLCAPFLPQL